MKQNFFVEGYLSKEGEYMDLFNNINGVENLFENEEVNNQIKSIVTEFAKYDIYDAIARISGLNLLPENQNKSILLDRLIASILYEKEDIYDSNYKMSDGKFKRLIEQLNSTDLAMAIDPNENVFTQNVMFIENYTVFNGIDYVPAYNLQMLIDILFHYENDFPKEYLNKVRILITMLLEISDELAYKINLKSSDIISDENRKIIIPDGNKIKKYASYVIFEEQIIESIFENNHDLLNDIIISFGTCDLGSIDNRPFYCRPFVRNPRDKTIILLNVSILATFAFFKTLNIAEDFNIKNKVINRYNNFIWRDCKKSLKVLGHNKIKEKQLNIELENRDYYKEMVATVYNDQLMLTIFICDDAFDYNENTLHSFYPDERHSLIFKERMKYYQEKIKKLEIGPENIFCMVILSGIGRGISLRAAKNPSKYEPLKLNPFELHCIGINERKEDNFLPRYFRAKDKINMFPMDIFSELNTISIYTDNNYSFYLSDDFNPNETMLTIAPGDSVDYIRKAINREDALLLESYVDGWKTKVESIDNIRNIYREKSKLENEKITICVRFNNCVIWITSDEIVEKIDINLYSSIIDTLSFWLAECKTIIEKMDLNDILYHFNIILYGNKKEYYFEPTEDIALEDIIKVEGNDRHYDLIWNPKAFGQMNSKTNIKEKELCQIVLEVLNQNTYTTYEYIEDLDHIFSNPLKKKFFSIDVNKIPCLKPIVKGENIKIRVEDENYLLDIIGNSILSTGKWGYEVIPDTDRIKLVNDVVGMLYGMLQSEIEQLDSNNLIEAIYSDLEKTLYSLMLARKRYAYDLACYPEKEEEYIKDYNDINRTSMALKFMMEYVAAKPPKGNTVLGIGKYEYILAICSLIIDWAYKNDLFYYDIFNTPVQMLKSNRIGMRQNEFIDLYQYGYRFRREQLYYNSSSNFRKKYVIDQKDYSKELDEAFISDYGYTFEQFYKVIAGMIEIGNKKEYEEIYVVNKDILVKQLLSFNEDLTLELINKVVRDISLRKREDFLKLPTKYRKEDVYPWRFNRAYSFTRRPVIIRGTEVIWGNRQLHHMLIYVIDLIYSGKFSTKDIKMATLIGRISNDRGNRFNRLIADMLLDMKIFEVDINVKKINNKFLTDENGNTLGDIDILIIDKERHYVYIAEVKDFSFSRNPYEIQQEYQKMFVDNKNKCFVTKHNRRVCWVQNHLEDLISQYQLENISWEIRGLFIVSEPLISNHVYDQNIEVIYKAELSIDRIRDIN